MRCTIGPIRVNLVALCAAHCSDCQVSLGALCATPGLPPLLEEKCSNETIVEYILTYYTILCKMASESLMIDHDDDDGNDGGGDDDDDDHDDEDRDGGDDDHDGGSHARLFRPNQTCS